LTRGSRQHFADRLAALVEERRSRVVLGLDPDPARLWPAAVERARAEGQVDVEAATARAVSLHCQAAIEAAGPACVAVKLQLACFERVGGWNELDEVASFARGRGLLVIADAKRGDVPVTARAYAQAFLGETTGPFGHVRGLGVDALTVNPLLGRDSLEPFVEIAAAVGAGVFSLVRTSNPGAAELQDQGDPPLRERLARMVDELGAAHVGDCGLSCVGAVVGATEPRLVGRLRELLPRAVLLLPGVGAQGGRVDDLGPAFEPHPAAGLVTASRSIVDAYIQTGADPASAAVTAADALREAAWRL
jgi:orotidine-5'-phosphate decarboxylase